MEELNKLTNRIAEKLEIPRSAHESQESGGQHFLKICKSTHGNKYNLHFCDFKKATIADCSLTNKEYLSKEAFKAYLTGILTALNLKKCRKD